MGDVFQDATSPRKLVHNVTLASLVIDSGGTGGKFVYYGRAGFQKGSTEARPMVHMSSIRILKKEITRHPIRDLLYIVIHPAPIILHNIYYWAPSKGPLC